MRTLHRTAGCSYQKITTAFNLGVAPLIEAGPGFPFIRLQALGSGPVYTSIPNAKLSEP